MSKLITIFEWKTSKDRTDPEYVIRHGAFVHHWQMICQKLRARGLRVPAGDATADYWQSEYDGYCQAREAERDV